MGMKVGDCVSFALQLKNGNPQALDVKRVVSGLSLKALKS